MKVHIVEPYTSMAMRRMSYPLEQALPKLYEVTKSAEADLTADVNIYIPWHPLATMSERGAGKHIIAYTHCNPPDVPLLIQACENADQVVCMSYTGRKELVNMGIDPAKLWVNYCGSDGFVMKRVIVGIIGYPQPNGRKRESILLDLAWQYDLTAFHFIMCGEGWEDTVNKLRSLGVKADCLVTAEANLQEIYQQIDVMLVTGYVEGGSLPILEAMAVGTPVMSPEFGYAADLLDRHYKSHEDLMDWLNEIAEPKIYGHQLSRAWGWIDYAKEYGLLIGRLLGNTTEIYPEFAGDRYTQLLNVIDEIQPTKIAEIGTWDGNRALQMIQQAAKYQPIEDIDYQGFDLFAEQTGEQFRRELSKQGQPFKVVQKRLDATGAWIDLIAGDTNKTILDLSPADLYFVDGGHSEKTIQNDGEAVLELLEGEAVAVFDDYYHEGRKPKTGCNKFIDGLDRNEYEVTHLPVRTKAEDGRVIGMVKVKRNANLHIRMSEETYTGNIPQYVGVAANIVQGLQSYNAQDTASG